MWQITVVSSAPLHFQARAHGRCLEEPQEHHECCRHCETGSKVPTGTWKAADTALSSSHLPAMPQALYVGEYQYTDMAGRFPGYLYPAQAVQTFRRALGVAPRTVFPAFSCLWCFLPKPAVRQLAPVCARHHCQHTHPQLK
eukprot:GHRR01030632.1.p1 GENE.GHRR01030632.1~~GHRR01030632.1.p1  ORF type:complete len:141 (-),score=28.10 GHRR01030632.1:446-868(-)